MLKCKKHPDSDIYAHPDGHVICLKGRCRIGSVNPRRDLTKDWFKTAKININPEMLPTFEELDKKSLERKSRGVLSIPGAV